MTEQKNEVRPCPFCGNIPKDTWTVTELGTKYPAYKCECFNRRIIAHKWNNAYCWDVMATNEFEDDLEHGKEVARLKAVISEKEAVIKALVEAGKGYLFNGHEPSNGDIVHVPEHCRQSRLEAAIALAEGRKK